MIYQYTYNINIQTRVRLDYVTILNRIWKLNFKFELKTICLGYLSLLWKFELNWTSGLRLGLLNWTLKLDFEIGLWNWTLDSDLDLDCDNFLLYMKLSSITKSLILNSKMIINEPLPNTSTPTIIFALTYFLMLSVSVTYFTRIVLSHTVVWWWSGDVEEVLQVTGETYTTYWTYSLI